MVKKVYDSAFPVLSSQGGSVLSVGLSKREYAAIEILKAFVAKNPDAPSFDRQIVQSVKIADLLLKVTKLESPDTVPAERVEFYTIIDGQKRKVTNMFLKITQKLPLFLSILDAQGNQAKVDGKPAWSLTDEAMGKLEVNEDGMGALLTPAGKVADFKVQVKVDADLGEGVKELLGELDISLISGEAVTVALSAGEPTDI